MVRLEAIDDVALDLLAPADEEAVMRAFLAKIPVDSEVAERVRERSRRVRDEVYRRHGLVDVAVPAIRELRGQVP
jgi:hypothetical protein